MANISRRFAKMTFGARLGRAEEHALGDPFCMTLSFYEAGRVRKDKVDSLPSDSSCTSIALLSA